MFDVVTYALVKKLVGQAATGIAGAEYKDGKLIFTLADGSTLEVPLDISSGVKGARINEENALVIDFSDGTSLTYAAALKEDLEKLEEKVAAQEQNLQILSESHHNLNEAFNDLGLSVVDGKLHITYEGGENPNE